MKILKSNSFTPIDSTPFEIPFPTYFELYYNDQRLATYCLMDEYMIDYSFDSSQDIPILTPEKKEITMNDIYFLFARRVFPRFSPYAPIELQALGLTEYNPYQIVRKTHGLMQNDMYWFKFPDDDRIDTFEKAAELFNSFHKTKEKEQQQ